MNNPKSPLGKFRLVRVDANEHNEHFVQDFDVQDDAIQMANINNAARQTKTSDIYVVYDDQGEMVPIELGFKDVSIAFFM